jgi:DedD protein
VKERLTGAIILVVLIVLLVPELLSGPSRSVPAPQAAATSSEEPPLRSYTIDLADDSHSAESPAGTSDASPQASGPAQPPPITESPAPAQQPDSDSSTGDSPNSPQATATQTPEPAAGTAPAASTAPATSTALAAGTAAEMPREQPKPASPWGSSSPAPQQRSAAAETAEKPSPTGGWAVQLGVFSIQANAERLAQELKSQGFHALVSENSGGGRPLWRVRTGPVAERAAAEQLNGKLRAAGHAGSVVPK